MKLSAQEEYGLRCLVQIARKGADGSCTIQELSQSEGISVPHVAKMMRLLRQAGFVKSTRGQAGGYQLAQGPEQIPVGKVLDELGGRLFASSFCDQHAGLQQLCKHTTDCVVRSLWQRLQLAVDHALQGLTLQDLMASEPKRPVSVSAGALTEALSASDAPKRSILGRI